MKFHVLKEESFPIPLRNIDMISPWSVFQESRIDDYWNIDGDVRMLFPVAEGTAKLSRGDHEFREPTPRPEQPVRSEVLSGELQGEPEEPQPTESKDDAEARKDFWCIQGDFIYRHHIEPRVCREKNHYLFH